ncbi:MAG TPA: Fic family protein [Clostridiaceae bacterium]|nr:Fic family protein [Clostridiaceae bacterium]
MFNPRSGSYQNQLSGKASFKVFVPAPLPPDPPIEMDAEMVQFLVNAHSLLAKLNVKSTEIPSMNLFVSMYVRKEALLSSQIEGTQASLEDVLDPTIDENLNREVADVVNYIRATDYAIGRLDQLPLSGKLLRETHAILMQGVRGQEKRPGEFRISQNWIGGPGSTLETARYVPPGPDDMVLAMSGLEYYFHGSDALDVLIRAGLIHYQFETIHPFLDGNGRMGRLLILLYLMDQGVLSSPALYISYYLKQHRIEYYDRLDEVRKNGDYEQWVKFFLQALAISAEDALNAIHELSLLHEKNKKLIGDMGRGRQTAMRVFTYLESHPVIVIGDTAKALDLAFNTVSSAVGRLEEAGILQPMTSGRRRRKFVYRDYLDILQKGTE